MSEKDKQMAEWIAEQSAQRTMARILEAAQNPETAGRVLDNWSGEVQRIVGRAVLRLVGYIFVISVGFIALNDNLIGHLKDLFKLGPK